MNSFYRWFLAGVMLLIAIMATLFLLSTWANV